MTHNFEQQAPYARHLARDRRLVILRVLADSAGYQANEYILETMLEELGHVVGSDLLHGELAWLAEQGLLTQQRVAAVLIATLTRRGLDVARGRAAVPGVARPQPE
ncbi:VpaChn25_0724 family phage protein [Ottowia cancrivicina]|uniref:ArsR family transcriptional regulator n=1 Tax=Ottowia cancrivicina TaxID=3040346 RepID=A0AAW6RKM7_9BURK|nr:ArsR family transcriptional regulator [Ottowia sp. 10c7w1]MDG9699277.1 ArsR family transcriptional regulator [Ottowia sp. 10c7w1]